VDDFDESKIEVKKKVEIKKKPEKKDVAKGQQTLTTLFNKKK
jgi:hypothetical protein